MHISAEVDFKVVITLHRTTKNITKSKEELFYMLHSASKIR